MLLSFIASHLVGIHGHVFATVGTRAFAFLMFVGWLYARLSLLLGHLAIGERMNWRAAWRDTRGHGLKIVMRYRAFYAVPVGLARPFGLVGTFFAIEFHDGLHGPVMEFTKIEILIAGLILLATGSAGVYRRYASSLIARSGRTAVSDKAAWMTGPLHYLPLNS